MLYLVLCTYSFLWAPWNSVKSQKLWHYATALQTSASLPPRDWLGIWVYSIAPITPSNSLNSLILWLVSKCVYDTVEILYCFLAAIIWDIFDTKWLTLLWLHCNRSPSATWTWPAAKNRKACWCKTVPRLPEVATEHTNKNKTVFCKQWWACSYLFNLACRCTGRLRNFRVDVPLFVLIMW